MNESGEVGDLILRILCLSHVSSKQSKGSYTYLLRLYGSHDSYSCHDLVGCILGPSISLLCLVRARGLCHELPDPESYFCRVVDVLLKAQPLYMGLRLKNERRLGIWVVLDSRIKGLPKVQAARAAVTIFSAKNLSRMSPFSR